VKPAPILLQPLLREHRFEVVRTYRCLIAFQATSAVTANGIATIDLTPSR